MVFSSIPQNGGPKHEIFWYKWELNRPFAGPESPSDWPTAASTSCDMTLKRGKKVLSTPSILLKV
jgi:hypothetical protein